MSELREWIDALAEHVEGAETLDAEGMRLLRTILREERFHTLLKRGEELERIEDACAGMKLQEGLDAAYQAARASSTLERLLFEATEHVGRTYDLEEQHGDLAAAVDMFLRDAPHVVPDPRRLRYALEDLARAEHEASEYRNPVLVP